MGSRHVTSHGLQHVNILIAQQGTQFCALPARLLRSLHRCLSESVPSHQPGIVPHSLLTRSLGSCCSATARRTSTQPSSIPARLVSLMQQQASRAAGISSSSCSSSLGGWMHAAARCPHHLPTPAHSYQPSSFRCFSTQPRPKERATAAELGMYGVSHHTHTHTRDAHTLTHTPFTSQGSWHQVDCSPQSQREAKRTAPRRTLKYTGPGWCQEPGQASTRVHHPSCPVRTCACTCRLQRP